MACPKLAYSPQKSTTLKCFWNSCKHQKTRVRLLDYGARFYDPAIARWSTPDPLVENRIDFSPYNYVQNNPLIRVDPNGALDEPVYGLDGNYIGVTKEGFTGEVLIYSGQDNVDFSTMYASEAKNIEGVDTYDNLRSNLSGDTKSNIWTHIASQFEGQQVFEETFSLSTINDRKVGYDPDLSGGWSTDITNKSIIGSDKYLYETTVENIQSSIVIHEWYSHVIKKVGNYAGNHSIAFENVKKYSPLWEKTTDFYKKANLQWLEEYRKVETSKGLETP